MRPPSPPLVPKHLTSSATTAKRSHADARHWAVSPALVFRFPKLALLCPGRRRAGAEAGGDACRIAAAPDRTCFATAVRRRDVGRQDRFPGLGQNPFRIQPAEALQ